MIDYSIHFQSYPDTLSAIGERAKKLRLSQNWTQQELADRSGVGVATLHRFEKTGQVSLENALRIATALRAEGGFARLFELPKYATLEEALGESLALSRRRARKPGRLSSRGHGR